MKRTLALVMTVIAMSSCCPNNRSSDECAKACGGRLKECGFVVECWPPDAVADAGVEKDKQPKTEK